MIKKNKKRILKKKVFKILYFLILVFFSLSLIYSYIFYKSYQKNKILIEKEKKIEQVKKEENFCSVGKYLIDLEKKAMEKKKHLEWLAHLAYEKRLEEASKSSNKVLIVSTSARGKKSFGYFYAFGDGFMFKKGPIASGRTNYETPIGEFNLKFKKPESMSNVYPDPSGVNNMNKMLAITNSGIALHEGSSKVTSHGCVHIPKKYSSWLYDWVNKDTKIYITNKGNIDYKHKKFEDLIKEIEEYNKIEKEKNSIETQKIVKWPNGNVKEKLRYRGGRLEGNQYFYYPNGRIKEIKNYYHNRRNGLQREYYLNGVKRKMTYLVGNKIWEMMTWNTKGEMMTYYKRPLPNKK